MNNIFSLWRRHCIALLLLALSMPFALSAQTQRSKEFQKKYTLKEVVVLSRHNIRAPLAGKGSIVSQLTPHEWNKWTASTGELTMRGGVVETMMGQYFRKWLADEGLIAEGVTPTADDVYFYANSHCHSPILRIGLHANSRNHHTSPLCPEQDGPHLPPSDNQVVL